MSWLHRLPVTQKVAGSSPAVPIKARSVKVSYSVKICQIIYPWLDIYNSL